MQIIINVEAELEERGIHCEAPHLAKEAIEIWINEQLDKRITKILDAHKVYYSEQ